MPELYTAGFPLAATPLPAGGKIPVDIPSTGGAPPQQVYLPADALGMGPIITLTDAANIATDASLGSVFQVTLGGNRTFSAPTNLRAGQRYSWKIVQDGTGNRTGTFNAIFKFAGGTPTLSTSANAVDWIRNAYYDGTTIWAVLDKAFA